MESIIQLIISGIAMGFIYCLVAVEYTLIFNATGLINFAHERFIILGAFFFGGTMVQVFSKNYLMSIVLTIVFMALFGVFTAKVVMNPLRNLPSTIFSVMGMLMAGYVMRELIRLIWGPNPFTIQGFMSGTLKANGIVFSKVYIYIIILSIVLLVAQKYFMTKTKIGKAVRCVAQDKEASALMGIDVTRNISVTVAISSIICGLVGILIIPVFSISHTMARVISLKGFAAGIVGGFGSYSGAIVGGLLLGIFENLYLAFGPSIYKDVVAFVLLIIVLLVKPTGIMGKSNGKSGRIKMRFFVRGAK